jgi:AraC-like DNA-binding protein
MQLVGIGKVVFWEGGSLWLARITGNNTLHRHHAIQLSLPVSGVVRFRRSPADDWVPYPGVVITPDVPHVFDAPNAVIAHILFEPESASGRALLRRYSEPGMFALAEDEAAALAAPLVAAHASNADNDELVTLARAIVMRLSGVPTLAVTADPRVKTAIRYIRDHLDEPLTLPILARASGLSAGRLRHLFVAETGVSTKSFILWERLNHALALGFGGMPWTSAAHATNFSDSAHLTRTCRRMFGLAPTAAGITETLGRELASS